MYNFEKQGYEPKDGTKVDIVPMPIETTSCQTIAKPLVKCWCFLCHIELVEEKDKLEMIKEL